ncbi:MAG: NAD(P)-dependent oxidoreductase [Gemmatimonadetes bacterium]|nr:NAD(P)-dependent oxidoreductase [Gemmatimonadota bacterium]MBP7551225.1 NAD(P)-dependent oxidoreductase [Gemmatimonadaceae bacterium]
MTTVAFLGLGAIGTPMAKHLARAPLGLRVWNRTAARAAAFAAEHGVVHAATPADAARGADVVITCFPVSSDVERLLDGADGLLAGLASGATLVDCTSGDPAGSQRIAAALAARGVGFLDAPVSGGVVGAEAAALTVMVGGDAALLARVRPVLEVFGKKIVHCGAVGAGDAVKAVNNGLLAIHLWSLAEGLAALRKAGVDPAVALDVINTSSGRSNASMNLFPERVLTRAFPRTFRLGLLDKDIGIAAQVAREQQVPAPLLQLTADLFRAAHLAMGEEADHVEVVKWVEQLTGVTIAKD